MLEEVYMVIDKIIKYVKTIISDTDIQIASKLGTLDRLIDKIPEIVPVEIYSLYREYFGELCTLISKSQDKEYYLSNREIVLSSLQLFIECLEEIKKNCDEMVDVCDCCGYEVVYENGVCPCCGCDEEERMEAKRGIDRDLCKSGPLVSVVMSAYNHEDFVAEAIESVLNQSYKNIEFIVADDASSDATADIMKKYEKNFSKSFYFNENAGGRTSWLIQNVSGKYVAVIDSDDVWEKDKVAMQVTYMERHCECDACFSWAVYTDRDLNELKDEVFLRKNCLESEWMRFFYEKGNALCHSSSLIKREVCMQMPKWGSAFRQLPDFFKWIDLIQRSKIHIIPRKLVRMRRYEKDGYTNTSGVTRQNVMRHNIEEGSAWVLVIRDMESDFFRSAFRDFMINSEAVAEEEIKCEKFFLLLNHSNVFVQNSAFLYFNECYNEIKDTLEKKYNYTRNDLALDMQNKGLAKILDS